MRMHDDFSRASPASDRTWQTGQQRDQGLKRLRFHGAKAKLQPVGQSYREGHRRTHRALTRTGTKALARLFPLFSCPLICYNVDGNTLTLNMGVSQPGDWICVITAGALKAGIDVKPGSDPNCLNVNGRGVIPVAILGSVELDVSLIDPASLNFAVLSVRMKRSGKQQCSTSDANSDGYDDLVCHFQDDVSRWSADGTTAELSGMLVNGTAFEGSDTICMVPAR